MPKEVFYWIAMCDACASMLGVLDRWNAVKFPFNPPVEECGVCRRMAYLKSLKSKVSGQDLRFALALVTRNSNEAKRQREEEERAKRAREVELRALELAVQIAKQSAPAQIRAKLADAKRVAPSKKRIITLE